MKRKDRFITKDSFFYALVIIATLAVTRIGFLIELVEYANAFSGYAAEAHEASADEGRSKERAIYLASTGEKK